ncbi:MAG: hypothetical protein Q9M30_03460 [Mariprofundaceae bacterium]|nr:hypothetical protein [Mariprofundaceae bacterium]
MSNTVISSELLEWVDTHAHLEQLSQRGGWPDGASLRIEVCSRSDSEMIADIYFDEVVREISVCDPVRDTRCGQFAIALDAAGQPASIRLLFAM